MFISSVFLFETGCASKRPWCLCVFQSFFLLILGVKIDLRMQVRAIFFQRCRSARAFEQTQTNMIAPCDMYMISVFLLETGCASKRPWCLHGFPRFFSSSDYGCEYRPAHVGEKTHVFSTTSESPGVRTDANKHNSPV